MRPKLLISAVIVMAAIGVALAWRKAQKQTQKFKKQNMMLRS